MRRDELASVASKVQIEERQLEHATRHGSLRAVRLELERDVGLAPAGEIDAPERAAQSIRWSIEWSIRWSIEWSIRWSIRGGVRSNLPGCWPLRLGLAVTKSWAVTTRSTLDMTLEKRSSRAPLIGPWPPRLACVRFVWSMGEMLAYSSHFRVSCVHWYSAHLSCELHPFFVLLHEHCHLHAASSRLPHVMLRVL